MTDLPLFEPSHIRYYSLARHALKQALLLSGISHGDHVLLPSFICRELLSSMAETGSIPVYYEVDENLNPELPPEQWPHAAAVIAVNYFGFPQNLEPFRTYVAHTGAVLIEDNAHGYFSRDIEGSWLGTRADIGIYSLRKTLPLFNGAMLYVSEQYKNRLPMQLPFNGKDGLKGNVIKHHLRKIPVLGAVLIGMLTRLARSKRRLMTGYSLPQASHDSEVVIPFSPEPYPVLMQDMESVDIDAEINRRRKAYHAFESLADHQGIKKVFMELPDKVAPYGFAFYARPDDLPSSVLRLARRMGFDLIKWPALPETIQSRTYYNQVYLVNFLQ